MRLGSWPLDQVMWGRRTAALPGSSLLAWLHHCLRPMQTMAVKESLDRPPGPPCQPTALTWLLSPWDGLFSQAQYIMGRVTNSSHWFLFTTVFQWGLGLAADCAGGAGFLWALSWLCPGPCCRLPTAHGACLKGLLFILTVEHC